MFPAHPFNYHISHKSRWSATPICCLPVYVDLRCCACSIHRVPHAVCSSFSQHEEAVGAAITLPYTNQTCPSSTAFTPSLCVCVLMTVCVCVYTERPGSKKCWGSAVADWENDFRADRDHCNSSNMRVCEPSEGEEELRLSSACLELAEEMQFI